MAVPIYRPDEDTFPCKRCGGIQSTGAEDIVMGVQ